MRRLVEADITQLTFSDKMSYEVAIICSGSTKPRGLDIAYHREFVQYFKFFYLLENLGIGGEKRVCSKAKSRGRTLIVNKSWTLGRM